MSLAVVVIAATDEGARIGGLSDAENCPAWNRNEYRAPRPGSNDAGGQPKRKSMGG
jgi:hypothetical protein